MKALFSSPLVCLSLTPSDDEILRYAADLAEKLQWHEIHFLHVAAPGSDKSADLAALRHEMQQLTTRHFSAPALVFHARTGARLDGILETVLEQQCDLILLGHRRERSGRRSLARRTALLAPASVWLVPEGSVPGIEDILVPVDFSSCSAEALALAARLATTAGTSALTGLHVYFDASTLRYDEHSDQVQGEEEIQFRQFLATVDTRGVQVRHLLKESTRPAQAILETASTQGSSLIVMNTRGRNLASYILLGSTTSETLTSTSIPLLVIKHHGAALTLMQALKHPDFLRREDPRTN